MSTFKKTEVDDDDSSVSDTSIDMENNKKMNQISERCMEIRIVLKNNENLLDYFESSNIKKELGKSSDILFVRFEIGEEFNGLSSSKLYQLSNKCINKSVLLHIESVVHHKCFLYWKSREIHYFLNYKSCDEKFKDNIGGFNDFVANFVKDSLKIGHLGLHHYYSTNNKTTDIQLHYFADSRGYNLLLLAAEAGNAGLIEFLFNLGLSPTLPSKEINAQILAWNGRHFDALLVLLKANLTYPPDFDSNECSPEIREFYQISLDLHQAIYSKNEEKIIQIIDNNPNLRHFYNYSNESAPRIALNCKNMDIYKLLLTRKIFLGRHETFNETWENFSNFERRTLREIHFKHSMYLPEKYLHDLTTNSRVAHDDPNVKGKKDLIQYAFEVLNGNPFTQIILMIVAASKKFQILFDFARDSVYLLDPTASFQMKGLFYSTGRIYISAWLLMFQSTENQTFGTLAHELCHYAMKLVFKNIAKPYYRNDRETKEKFEEISKICFENRSKEPMIDLVYEEYPRKEQHAELIVRVPHLTALYHDQPEKLKEIRENFVELFEYYEQKVVPEMQKLLPKIEAKNEVEKKDEKILKYKALLCIGGLFSMIGAVVAIIIILSVRSQNYSYKELSMEDKILVRNGPVNYKNIAVKFQDLFPENSAAYEKLTSEHIRQMINGMPLNFSDQHCLYLDKLVNHNWQNLTTNFKKKILNLYFSFQSESLKFIELHQRYPEILESLTSQQIVDILDDKIFTIETKETFKPQFFWERTFVLEKIDVNAQKGLKNRTLSEIVEMSDCMKIFLISAEAGTGKSATLQNMTPRIKKKFPIRWVSYIDLKNYIHFWGNSTFDRNINIHLDDAMHPSTNTESNALEVGDQMKNEFNYYLGTLRKILGLNSKSKFEQVIFQKLFITGNVTFLWDSIDEVYPLYNQSVLNLMSFIHKATNNSQIICTRPLYSRKLQDTFSTQSYRLGFFEGDQEWFLQKFLNFRVKPEELNATLQKVQSLTKSLEQKAKYETDNRSLDIPLMLKFIADIFIANEQLNSSNIYETYQIIFNEKIKIWESRADFIRNYFLNNLQLGHKFTIREIYQKYALATYSTEFSKIYEKSHQDMQNLTKPNIQNLKIMKIEFPQQTLYAEISHMEILYINSESHFRFLHKTFAEFFVAQYLIENIFLADENLSLSEVKLRGEIFLYIKSIHGFYNLAILEFMKDFLQNCNNVKHFCSAISKFSETEHENNFKDFSDIFKFFDEFYNKSCCM